MKHIPHNKPTLGTLEVQAATRVLRSGWIAEGKEVADFENRLSSYILGKKGHAAAVSNGTTALHIALKLLNIRAGDEVIVPTYTCSAVLNAVFALGAKPKLVDISKDDLNPSFVQIRSAITKKTKALMVTHTFGMPADMKSILSLGLPVIEDCAQALGSMIGKTKVGSFGTISVYSFYASKVITTGYGGMIISKNKLLIAAAKDFRAYDNRSTYTPRYNVSLSDMAASVGNAQFRQLNAFLGRRKRIADMYRQNLPSDSIWPSGVVRGRTSNNFRFLVKTNKPGLLIQALRKKGITAIVPIASGELLHRYLKQPKSRFPNSEWIATHTVSLPIYPSLADADVRKIIDCIQTYV